MNGKTIWILAGTMAALLTGGCAAQQDIARRIWDMPTEKRPDAVTKALNDPALSPDDRARLYDIMFWYERDRRAPDRAAMWKNKQVRLYEEKGDLNGVRTSRSELFYQQLDAKMLTEAESNLARLRELERADIEAREKWREKYEAEAAKTSDRPFKPVPAKREKVVTTADCSELLLLCAKDDTDALLKRHRELCAVSPQKAEALYSSMPPRLRAREIVRKHFEQKKDWKNLRLALDDEFRAETDPRYRLQIAAFIWTTWRDTPEFERETAVFLNAAKTIRRQVETAEEPPEPPKTGWIIAPLKKTDMLSELDKITLHELLCGKVSAKLAIPYADRLYDTGKLSKLWVPERSLNWFLDAGEYERVRRYADQFLTAADPESKSNERAGILLISAKASAKLGDAELARARCETVMRDYSSKTWMYSEAKKMLKDLTQKK